MLRTLLAVVVAALAALAAPAQAATVCKSAFVPDGYVIVAETDAPGCFGRAPNAWAILRADAPEIEVCRESPLPPTHLIVSNALHRPGCPYRPGAQFNGYVIRIPWDQEVICRDPKNVVDPDVYETLGVTSSFDCSDSGARDNALTIQRRPPFRGYCAGRALEGASGAWRLYFDRDGDDGTLCATQLEQELKALGATRYEISSAEYRFDENVQVKLDCKVGRATWISGKGNRAWRLTVKHIEQNQMAGCLPEPTTVPVRRTGQ